MEDGQIEEAGDEEEEEEEAERLQKADQNKMHSAWDYQRRLRTTTSTKNTATQKTDGTDCQGMSETMEGWDERAEECLIKEKK